MTNERRNLLIRFFAKHAGYCTPPGRMVCARNLANAITEAEERGYTFEWTWDEDPDLSWMSERERKQEHEVLGCIMRDEGGDAVASLWGIVDPDAAYQRVVEAELALEGVNL